MGGGVLEGELRCEFAVDSARKVDTMWRSINVFEMLST